MVKVGHFIVFIVKAVVFNSGEAWGQKATSAEPWVGAGTCGDTGNTQISLIQFNHPSSLLSVEEGLIVADQANNLLRLIPWTASGAAQTLVGGDASVDVLVSVAKGADGSLFFTDLGHQQVKRFNGLNVALVAGHKVPLEAAPIVDRGIKASFRAPYGVALDPIMNVFVSDMLDHRVRKINRYNNVVEMFAGGGWRGFKTASAPQHDSTTPRGSSSSRRPCMLPTRRTTPSGPSTQPPWT